MIIAATHSDEVNMVTCQLPILYLIYLENCEITKSVLFRCHLFYLYRRDHLPIDVVIPELEVAEAAEAIILS